MFRHRIPTRAIGLVAAAASLTLAGCTASTADDTATTAAATADVVTATNGTTVSSDVSVATVVEQAAEQAADADIEWDAADEIAIVLADGATVPDGDGVSVDGDTVTVTAPGTYRISGSLSDGRIVVDAADDGVVRLVLDGVDIASSSAAAVLVENAGDAVVVLAEGSTNRIVGGTTVAESTDAEDDAPNAALYSRDDLTITGTGSLEVEGSAADGITSKDDLLITGGTITVTAVDDGIRGKDQLVVEDGSISIRAGGDGLTSDNTGEADETTGETTTADVGHIVITGGTVDIAADTDAIDAVNTVTIAGGTIAIAAGDDAIHADTRISMSAGSVDITQSFEGVESMAIEISGGELHIVSSDDGINVTDGSGNSGGGPGGGSAASSDAYALISGGTITVDTEGDGLDANGSLTVTGGDIVVNGPTGQGNGALDVDGSFTVDGGVLIAGGSAGMAMAPDESGSEPTLSIRFGSTLPAATLVEIADEAGTVVATYTSTKSFESLVVSTPDLVSSATYTVSVDGEAVGTVTA